MRGFESHPSAARFCRAHHEVRDLLRPATRRIREHVCCDPVDGRSMSGE